MPQAVFRFYAELNDYLPSVRRQRPFEVTFRLPASVKHWIESLGAPHTEIDLILANGEPVDFSYIVRDGDHISVYPVFESIDITSLVRVRPAPLRQVRFVLDAHLGRLAAYLRMLGFDALYRSDYTDEALAQISSGEKRILLTRDRGLLKRSQVTHGYCVRADHPPAQAIEVVRRFDLAGALHPFTRCLRCNSDLVSVKKEAVLDLLPPGAARWYDTFYRCAGCGQVYWNGSHVRRMEKWIASIGENCPSPAPDENR